MMLSNIYIYSYNFSEEDTGYYIYNDQMDDISLASPLLTFPLFKFDVTQLGSKFLNFRQLRRVLAGNRISVTSKWSSLENVLRFTRNSSHGSNEFISRGMQISRLTSPVAYTVVAGREKRFSLENQSTAVRLLITLRAARDDFKSDTRAGISRRRAI